MNSDTPSATVTDPLDALLRQLTRSPDPIVGQWAAALLAGDAAIPKPFAGWSWAKRAVWLLYVPPHPEPTVEGDPFDDV